MKIEKLSWAIWLSLAVWIVGIFIIAFGSFETLGLATILQLIGSMFFLATSIVFLQLACFERLNPVSIFLKMPILVFMVILALIFPGGRIFAWVANAVGVKLRLYDRSVEVALGWPVFKRLLAGELVSAVFSIIIVICVFNCALLTCKFLSCAINNRC